MPFRSKAQMRYMFAAENRGDVPEGTAERWAKHTKNIKKLPEKVEETEKAAAEQTPVNGAPAALLAAALSGASTGAGVGGGIGGVLGAIRGLSDDNAADTTARGFGKGVLIGGGAGAGGALGAGLGGTTGAGYGAIGGGTLGYLLSRWLSKPQKQAALRSVAFRQLANLALHMPAEKAAAAKTLAKEFGEGKPLTEACKTAGYTPTETLTIARLLLKHLRG